MPKITLEMPFLGWNPIHFGLIACIFKLRMHCISSSSAYSLDSALVCSYGYYELYIYKWAFIVRVTPHKRTKTFSASRDLPLYDLTFEIQGVISTELLRLSKLFYHEWCIICKGPHAGTPVFLEVHHCKQEQDNFGEFILKTNSVLCSDVEQYDLKMKWWFNWLTVVMDKGRIVTLQKAAISKE